MTAFWSRLDDWNRSQSGLLVDVAAAVVMSLLAEFFVLSAPDLRMDRNVAAIAVLVPVLAVAVRRRAPVASFAVALPSTFLFIVLNVGVQGIWPIPALALQLCLYAVAAYRPRVVSVSCLIALFIAVFKFGDLVNADQGANFLAGGVPAAAVWFAGDFVRVRRAKARRHAAAAAREELKREELARQAMAEERARQAAAEERTRIARELHDVVAHSMSVMVVQAGAARRIVLADPTEAKNSLVSIERTGREGLVEMRRLLGVVRKRNGQALELAPQPGLEHLQGLIAKVRQAGLEVDMRVDGVPRPVGPGISLAVYRVVQEALTNTVKHSQATHVIVTLEYSGDSLRVDVRDDGHGQVALYLGDETGYGLIGLRERVALFGGKFESGNLPNYSGFHVTATIPLPSD